MVDIQTYTWRGRIPNQQKNSKLRPTCIYTLAVFQEMDDSTRAPTADYEAHERQLTMNRARRRQRLASETPEPREARLSTRRARRRQRLVSETPEQRETRLVMERVRTRRRLASETAEQRETRLCPCRARRTRQTSQIHEACLASQRSAMLQRRALESPEDREPRLYINFSPVNSSV